MKLRSLLALLLLCVSFNAFGASNMEFFALTGWNHVSPIAPYNPDWDSFLAGGASIPITKRFAVEGVIGRRRQFNGEYVHFSTKSKLSWLIGSTVFEFHPAGRIRPYAIGGFGLLHISE